MLKNTLKFFLTAVAIVVLGIGIIWGVEYFRYRSSPEYRAVKGLENLTKQYAQDPYGGETPEETLRLFIDALKKGDTDLAAKYFVLDKQRQWREDLTKIKNKNLLGDMVKDLERVKRYRSSSENQIFFTAGNEVGEAVVTADLIKINNKWKIREL